MVCPADRTSTGFLPTSSLAPTAATLCAAALCLLAPNAPAIAQDRQADPALEELIPDAAIDDPEGWAEDTLATEIARPDDPDPETPLADDPPGFNLAWPNGDEVIDAIEGIEPDPQLAEALDPDWTAPAVELALPEMGTTQAAGLAATETTRISKRITISYPPQFADFELREEFENRFEALSQIELLADDDDTLAQLGNRARTDQAMLEDLLRVYGFFDADVRQEVTTPPEGEGSGEGGTARAQDARFAFTIEPGTRYGYSEVDLGDLADAGPDYEKLRSSFEIYAGDPVNQDRVVTERIDLATELGESGYAFADVGDAELLIDHAVDAATLSLPVFPGGKYAFGPVISGNEDFLSSKHLADIARFDPGDVYQISEVDDLRRAILATGLVSNVTLDTTEISGPENGEPGVVGIEVEMTEAPLRTIAGGLGYSTGDGYRAEVSWEHRNFFPPEGMVRARAIVGTQERLAGLTFRRNNWRGRDRILTIDAFVNDIDREAYEAETISAIARFERKSTLIFQKEMSWGVGLEVLATKENEPKVKGLKNPDLDFLVAALPAYLLFDASDDLLDPSKGFRIRGAVSPETSRLNGAQSQYLKVQFDLSHYQSVGKNIVLAGRGRVGSIFGTEIFNIAPSRRFYAGGGGSVRGYGFEEIGPRNGVGVPNGGRSLLEFSAEARIRTGLFDDSLSVVPFVDAGAVNRPTTPSFDNMQYGAGIGIRYHTSFGPLRVDVATPLNPRPEDDRIAVYIALGQAF